MSAADLALLETETDAKGRSFTIHKLPIPALHQVVTEEDLPGYSYEEGEEERYAWERLAASYVNFYIANKSVLVPQFQDVNDQVAWIFSVSVFQTVMLSELLQEIFY